MCGFVAIVGNKGEGELDRMAGAVARRGPDDHGHFDDGTFSSIHHRLSIIGPDKRGRQPMSVDEVTVVFNGCIYNFRELRRQLEKGGIRFTTDTDTEILPHLYRCFGMGMFSLLNGMFSIVIWDARKKLLTAARDPFGEKPLFICEQDGRIGLASVLSAFEHGNWELTPNLFAVRDVLCRMRIEAPRTMYREVRQLPAGCYALGRAGEALSTRRYFFLPEADQPQGLAPGEEERAVAGMLDQVFLARTISDRPMGVFLSGGVDSSLIAESLARQLPDPLHTFSVRFSDGASDYDESPHAAAVAKHIGSVHTVLEVRADAQQCLEEVADAFDQPVANATALPTFLIAREAKAHVDVALSGVGGDELFGGYPRYLGMAWHGRLRRLPGRRILLALLHGLGEGSGHRNLRGRLRRLLESLDVPVHEAYAQWVSSASGPWETMFVTARPEQPQDVWQSSASVYGGLEGLIRRYGTVNGAMAYDVLTYLADDLLAMGDRMSMAQALELRSPFLDTRLLSLVLTLDATLKVAGPPWREGLKLLLKRIARQRLPSEVVDRPKQGFMAPVKHWLRGPLAGDVRRLIESDPAGGLIRRDYVRQIWQQHHAGRDRSDALWALLLLDAWMNRRQWSLN